MIQNEGKYYLYRHIRLDKNEPFYVGIGTKQKCSEYGRAFSKIKRNIFWKRIVEKTDYEVEILLESDDYEFIKQKEIEFIALHGRRDLGKGGLTNLTDGGDGSMGRVFTEEQKENHKLGKNPRAIKVVEISTGNVYDSCKEASEYLGLTLSNFCGMLNTGKRKNTTGFKYLDESLRKEEYVSRKNNRKVYDYSTGEIIESILQASKIYNIHSVLLEGRLKGKYKNDTNLIFYEDYLKGVKPNELHVSKRKSFEVINTETGEVFNSMYAAHKTSDIDKTTFKRKVQNKLKNNTPYILLEEYNEKFTMDIHFLE